MIQLKLKTEKTRVVLICTKKELQSPKIKKDKLSHAFIGQSGAMELQPIALPKGNWNVAGKLEQLTMNQLQIIFGSAVAFFEMLAEKNIKLGTHNQNWLCVYEYNFLKK